MAKSTSLLQSRGWKKGVAMLYGIGAAIVIIGALFKILHWPGANEMLIVGLSTEALIFFVSAFEPLPEEEAHWKWNKVFPQLNTEDDGFEDTAALGLEGNTGNNYGALSGGLSSTHKLLQENQLKPELFENLAESIKGLKISVTNLADISDATVATNEYHDSIRRATERVNSLSQSYGGTLEAMNTFGSAVTDAQAYQTQLQGVTRNLESLNAVYQMELEDAQKHLRNINQFYGGVANVMNNIVATGTETEQLRTEVTSLTRNLQSLNSIYGGMLNAMASAGNRQ